VFFPRPLLADKKEERTAHSVASKIAKALLKVKPVRPKAKHSKQFKSDVMSTSLISVSLIICGIIFGCIAIAWLISSDYPKQDIQHIQQDHETADGTGYPSTEPYQVSHWLRMCLRGQPIIAQPDPSDEQHRAAEQMYWRESLRKQGISTLSRS